MTHEYQGNKQTATKEHMGTGALARGCGSRRRSNTLNFEGNPMCCRICGSPHSYENQSKQVFESKENTANEVRNLSLKDEHVLMHQHQPMHLSSFIMPVVAQIIVTFYYTTGP